MAQESATPEVQPQPTAAVAAPPFGLLPPALLPAMPELAPPLAPPAAGTPLEPAAPPVLGLKLPPAAAPAWPLPALGDAVVPALAFG